MIRRADGTLAQVTVFQQPNKNLQNVVARKPASDASKPVTVTVQSPEKGLTSYVYSGEPSSSGTTAVQAEPRKTVQITVPNLDGQADAKEADETATTLSTGKKQKADGEITLL